MKKLDGKSMDIVSENITKLKEIFPDVFSEGKVDFEALEATLGEYVDTKEERYSFNWNGKAKARRIAQTPSTGTLRPAKEESKNWDTTENLYIEGDNLEVLKLLQKSYHKQVKMIYIDPPYNTGKDFVYKDNFKDNIKNYLEQTGQVDSEGNKLGTNSDTSGRYHSDWLNMMYPRLKLSRNLLKDDGVIFISIDENEVSNLRKICDEIYGEDNCISVIANINNPKGRSDDKYIATAHEYLLVYAKNIELFTAFGFEAGEEIIKRYNKIDENGDKYREIDLRKTGDNDLREDRPNLFYYFLFNQSTEDFYPTKDEDIPEGYIQIKPIRQDSKEGNWRWGIDTAKEKLNKLVVKFMPNREIWGVVEKDYLKSRGWTKATSARTFKDVNSERGSEDFIKLGLDKKLFPKPKPLGTIKRAAKVCMDKDEPNLILDFFSGSASSAHAIMQLNSEDGGNRNYIMVQLPEQTGHKDYPTICEVGKERIRRVGEKIKFNNPDKDFSNIDIGFKVFKLDSSNIKAWDPESDNLEQSLFEAVNNIKSGRTEEDLLYEILLKYGLDLTLPIEELELAGKKVYVVGLGALVICLDEQITLDTVEEIAKLKEQYEADDLMRVVFRDNGFKDAEVKTNAIQILKQSGIDDVKSL